MDHLLYGAAYYDEYMKEERLETDMRMMKEAGLNTIRIAESTWSTEEPQEGVFDFSHVCRTIEMAEKYGISVIVGTPTYAVPPWLVNKYPDILAQTENGPEKYGARQNMDITNPHYLFYAERIIRKLLECVQKYGNVIGFQLDNETKHYHTAGPGVQQLFRKWLKERFGTVENMNRELGLAYWSNAADCWENVPDVTGTVNGSLLAEFEKFRRNLVTEFLLRQRKIAEQYIRPGQFITHNFDFEWREYSYGVQPDVNHSDAARAVTVAGCDIYHPSQSRLTGKEAAFCGSIARSLKQNNYYVLETQAQGQVEWTPYPGQLRLQAYSHIANGADAVLYWHWHSIHNSYETYWRGILGHDLAENRLYRECKSIGTEFAEIGDRLLHLKKRNRAAVLISNESLTALSRRPLFPLPDGDMQYNDVVRSYADALYSRSVEYDIVWPSRRDFSQYDLLIVPVLYSASDDLLYALKEYVSRGGTLLATFKTGYADEYLTVHADTQPHILHECLGVTYQEYTLPEDVTLAETGNRVISWMEFLQPGDAKVLASYGHPEWNRYAAVTENRWGKGKAIYAGCHLDADGIAWIVDHALTAAGLDSSAVSDFPVIHRSGVNQYGKNIHYFLNYSGEPAGAKCPSPASELLTGKQYLRGESIQLPAWGVSILEACSENPLA